MKVQALLMSALLSVVLLSVSAEAFHFDNQTIIRPTASKSLFFVADYVNVTESLTFNGQPADMIIFDGMFLNAQADTASNVTITWFNATHRALQVVNSTLAPSMIINMSGFTANYNVGVFSDDAWVSTETINSSGWLNMNFTNLTGAQTIITFNESTPPDVTPPVFTNLINHSIEINNPFSYDVDATDMSGLDTFVINSTNYTINGATGVITNVTTLNYTFIEWINISVNDTYGFLAWEIFYINVTPVSRDGALGLIEGKFYQDKWFVFTFIELPIEQDIIMPSTSIYHSIDRNVLVYKDPDGVVHELY